MDESINIILQRIVERKAKEFSFEKEKRNHIGSIVSIFQEEYHLFKWMNQPNYLFDFLGTDMIRREVETTLA